MNDTAVGLYATAIKIKSLVTPLIATITGILLSRASFYVSNNNSKKYDELIQKGLGITLFLFPMQSERPAFADLSYCYFAEKIIYRQSAR